MSDRRRAASPVADGVAVDQRSGRPARGPGRRRAPEAGPRPGGPGARWDRRVLAAAVVVVAATGLWMHLWYLGHVPVDADEAAAAMAAQGILHGHLAAFYPGQQYGGAELYLVAAAFALFGSSLAVLGTVPVVLAALAAVVVWRIAGHLLADPLVAAVPAVLTWAFPDAAVYNATREYGFRGVTMVCGLLLVLAVVRARRAGALRPADAVLAGSALGVGWWSSPEVVYFVVPAALWLVPLLRRQGRAAAGPAAAGLLAAAAGAVPWLWANAGSGLASLRASGYYVPGTAPGYLGRLGDFATGVVPTLLDLRDPSDGTWLVAPAVGVAVAAAAAVALAATCARALARRPAARPLAVGVVAFPFLESLVPGSWLWESARYDVFVVPLVLLLAAAVWGGPAPSPAGSRRRGVARPGRRPAGGAGRSRPVVAGSALACAAVVVAGLLGVGSTYGFARRALPHHGGIEAVARQAVRALEAAGVVHGVADYWVAYTLDEVSGGRLRLAASPPSPDRFPGLLAAFRAAPARSQWWVFVTPTASARAEFADSPVIAGPSGLPLASFLGDAAAAGDRCSVRRAGLAALARCDRPVTFAQLSLHPHR